MFENKYIQQRIEKAEKLREVGINPYSNESSRNCTIAKYLNGIYQYVSYEILNYNPLAEAKYHLVDREYCFEENPKLYTKEQMQEFKSWAVEGGLENIIIES